MKYVIKDKDGKYAKRVPPYYYKSSYHGCESNRKFESWFRPYIEDGHTVLIDSHVSGEDKARCWKSLKSAENTLAKLKEGISAAYKGKKREKAMTFFESLTIEKIGKLEKDSETKFKGDYAGIKTDKNDDTRASCMICKMALAGGIPYFYRPSKVSTRNVWNHGASYSSPKICAFCAKEMGKAADKELGKLDPEIVDNIIKDRFIRHI
jgi:hypothetical protein